MVLTMASLLAHLVPPIRFEARDQFLNLRWHRCSIVLCATHGRFPRGVLSKCLALFLLEGSLAVRSEMLGPLARDRDLIGALVGHLNLTPNVRAKRATTAWRAGQQAQNGP